MAGTPAAIVIISSATQRRGMRMTLAHLLTEESPRLPHQTPYNPGAIEPVMSRSRSIELVIAAVTATCLLVAGLESSARLAAQTQSSSRWWSPGDGRTLPAAADYANADGALGILNSAGAIDTKTRSEEHTSELQSQS